MTCRMQEIQVREEACFHAVVKGWGLLSCSLLRVEGRYTATDNSKTCRQKCKRAMQEHKSVCLCQLAAVLHHDLLGGLAGGAAVALNLHIKHTGFRVAGSALC